MASFESSIRRVRRALVVLAASLGLPWAATTAQAQEGLCGVVPASGIDDSAWVACNITGCPVLPNPDDPFGPPLRPMIPSMSQDMFALYLAQLNLEWGPVPLGNGPFCSKAAQNFVKVCRTVVKSSVDCVAHQIDGLAKQDTDSCKAFAGSEAKACAASVDAAAQAYLAELATAQTTAERDCTITTGNRFFRTCMFNVP